MAVLWIAKASKGGFAQIRFAQRSGIFREVRMKNEPDDASTSSPKKTRFAPKLPIRKRPKAVATKGDKPEIQNNVIDKELLAKLNGRSKRSYGGVIPKTERKSAPVQVVFGHGSTSLIRSFGNPRSAVEESTHEVSSSLKGSDVAAIKEYVEPWDYVHSHYPATLPLRRPYSGDPEILDNEEFGDDAISGVNLPSTTNAKELGLMGASTVPQMFLFQLPAALPLAKDPVAAVDSRRSDGKQDAKGKSRGGCSLKDLPAGYVGKMLVHKSGKIKMKIGDAVFNVSPGQNCVFAEEFAVMNVKEKHCCIIGDRLKRAVVTPDIDSLLQNL